MARSGARASRRENETATTRRRRRTVAASPIADLRRLLSEQGFLRNARENYPAWMAAIESAGRTIHLEMYIVHDDGIGRRFRDLLVARARAGVTVRVLY